MVMLNLTDASVYLRKQKLKDFKIYLRPNNTVEIKIQHYWFRLSRIANGVQELLGNDVNWKISKLSFWQWLFSMN